MGSHDTIVALATPQGTGALAIIRVSGSDSHHITGKTISEKEKFFHAAPGTIRRYTLVDSSAESIDAITAIRYDQPQSFTGEDMVEIFCHGGEIVVTRVLEALIDAGSRYAEKGEFTRRAFVHGKTDLIRAEAIHQLVMSKTIQQQKSAIATYMQDTRGHISSWHSQITEILVAVETSIEFGDEDANIRKETNSLILDRLAKINKEIGTQLQRRALLSNIEQGVFVAIAGPANAGKSSILNLVVGYERSIVDAEAGTTRDYVSEIKMVDSVPVTLIDTAGLKNGASGVERIGIARSNELIKDAHLCVWVTAADEKVSDLEKRLPELQMRKVLGIVNKIDRSDGIEKMEMFDSFSIPHLETTALLKENRETVENFIVSGIREIVKEIRYDCVIGTKRQEKLVQRIIAILNSIDIEELPAEEIIAEQCREILGILDEYTGKTTSEEIINTIFNEFCIGK
jgi:tRNA modification GTPase